MSKEDFLAKVTLFKDLDAAQLAELAADTEERNFGAGSEVIRQGDPGDGLYIVVSGLVQVTGKLEKGQAREEGEAVLSVLGPGEAFGELSLLDGKPRSATVVASWSTKCLFLSREDFLKRMRRHPQIAFALLPVLCERIREADQRIAQLV